MWIAIDAASAVSDIWIGNAEADAATWLALVTGSLAWDDAVTGGRVDASGARADLAALLPLAFEAGTKDLAGLVPEAKLCDAPNSGGMG